MAYAENNVGVAGVEVTVLFLWQFLQSEILKVAISSTWNLQNFNILMAFNAWRNLQNFHRYEIIKTKP